MTRKSVRLRDVALAANTSTRTASRVINGDDSVCPETRLRVKEQVKNLGYTVDVLARTLRTGVDDAIAVIVPSISDPFFATMLEEFESVALEQGYSLLIASNSRELNQERRVLEGLLARRVAGILVAPFDADYGFLSSISTPVVFIDRHPRGLETGAVIVDDYLEAKKAVHYLHGYGHRQIALVVDDLGVETSRLRHDGYLAALEELSIPINQHFLLKDCARASIAYERVQELLSSTEQPTAIFSARSETSLGVVKALHISHRTDIAMLSFGDFVNADILSPPISVLNHDSRELARRAVNRLMVAMNSEEPQPGDDIVPLSIIARGSGELRPAPRGVKI